MDQPIRQIIDEFLSLPREIEKDERVRWLHERLQDDDVLSQVNAMAHSMLPAYRNLPAEKPLETLIDLIQLIRRRVGRFRCLRVLGMGGQGLVYQAFDEELKRDVALKVISKKAETSQQREQLARFRHEVETTAELQHPNIITIYQWGEDDGLLWYVMRRASDSTLRQAIVELDKPKNGSIRRRDVRAFRDLLTRFVQVCNAVGYAHSRGIVNRDLKPDNVMIGNFGETLVIDWGLAKAISTEEGQTSQICATTPRDAPESALSQRRDIVGSWPYMSPEQASGDTSKVTVASDIYSLGAILFAILTGQTPVYCANLSEPEVRRRKMANEIRKPSQLNPATPRALEVVCLKALATNPAQRYSQAGTAVGAGGDDSLAADVERWLNDEPVCAWSEPLILKTQRALRRHPRIVGLSVGAIFVGMVAVASFIGLVNKKNVELQNVNQTLDERNAALGNANNALSEKNVVLASALGYQYWRKGDVSEGTLVLDRVPPSQRQWEWHYLRRLCGANLLRIYSQGRSTDAQFSSDDRRLLVGIEDRLTLWDARTWQIVCEISVKPRLIEGVALSADGQRMAALVGGGKILIWDANSGKSTAEIGPVEITRRNRISFHPGGQLLLTPRGAVHEVATGKKITGPPTSSIVDAVWAPNGEWFATTSPAEGSNLVGIWTPAGKPRGAQASPAIGPLAVSPDSQQIALGLFDGINVIDATSGRLLRSYRGIPENTLDLCYSRDGNRIAVAGSEGTIRVWNVGEVSVEQLGGEAPIATLRGHESPVTSVAFSGDGTRLAGTSREAMRIWDPTTDPEVTQWATSAGMHAFAPTGQQLVALHDQSGWTIYDVATRGTVLRQAEGGKLTCVAYSPQGDRLATGGPAGITVWNTHDGRRVSGWSTAATNLLAYDPRRGRLVSAGDDNLVRLWDLAKCEQKAALKLQAKVQQLKFRPNSNQVAILVAGRIELWDTENLGQPIVLPAERVMDFDIDTRGALLATAHNVECGVQVWDLATLDLQSVLPARDAFGRVAFHPQSQRVAAASGAGARNRQVVVWDLVSRQAVISFSQHGLISFISQLAFSPDGRWLMGHGASLTRLWDGQSGVRDFVLAGHGVEVSSLGFLPNGRLVSASYDRTLRVWELDFGIQQAVLRGPNHAIVGFAASPDGKWVAASGDSRVHLWDIAGGEPRSWKADQTLVAHLALSPDGKTLAVLGSNNQVRTYEAPSGRLLREFAFSCQQYGKVAFNPHADQLLFTGGDGESGRIMAWNPKTGKLLWNREYPTGIGDLAFAPNGGQFAIAQFDGTVHLCDSRTGNPGQVFKAQSSLHALAWSPNSQWLAAGGLAREVWVWNVKTGQEVADLRQSSVVRALAFSIDSSRLAVGTFDGLIRLIPVNWLPESE